MVTENTVLTLILQLGIFEVTVSITVVNIGMVIDLIEQFWKYHIQKIWVTLKCTLKSIEFGNDSEIHLIF